MERTEIIALAQRAQTNVHIARGAFKRLAQAEGFTGAVGGWIYFRGNHEATVQGWQNLANLVATGRVRFVRAEAGEAAPAKAPVKAKSLSPAMQRLVRALEQYGHIDPIRDCGPHSGVNTLVALMDRGIIREAKRRHGVHFPVTTPEQVWSEARAEYARREAEQTAHAECAEQWVTAEEVHTRTARGGYPIEIEQGGHRFWYVRINGHTPMTAGGTWQEARRAADNYEREQAHNELARQDAVHAAHCCLQHGCKYGTEDCAVKAGRVTADGSCESREDEGWGQPDGMLGATEAQEPVFKRHLLMANATARCGEAHPTRTTRVEAEVQCPGCLAAMQAECDELTVEDIRNYRAAVGLPPVTSDPPDTEAQHNAAAVDGMARKMAAQVIARRADSQTAGQALADVAALRAHILRNPAGTVREVSDTLLALDRIEAALKGGK